MSTFSGNFSEFPLVSADRFDGNNLNSKVFLLSHCHMDHMAGLDNPNGLPGPLYTSAVSKVFVRKQFPNVKEMRVLEIESPEEISYSVDGTEHRIVVTALAARHCPGSVMFLIQSHDHKVLYTGDFRLTKADLQLNYSSLQCMDLDVMYLDSTFLNKNYMHFPTQTDSINVICKLISNWISKSRQHKVIIRIPAQYGSEFLFTEIGRKLNQKICVHSRQLEKYIFFPDLDHCISTDLEHCQIWLRYAHEKKKCTSPLHCLIQPSAIYWRNWEPSKPICKEIRKNVFRVAYSSHSSYSEIKDFIEFVRPKKVELNVISVGNEDGMRENLNEILYGTNNQTKLNNTPKTYSFDNIFKVPSNKNGELPEKSLKMPIKRIKL